ncbi:RagB/SusD family nutrient uptake outer membrane protein [Labilibacter marinus]|uniref:RagB/SusD family nutrient uptake outer membrane protein n=1 Tax=Labilibacter marinus TaxID=1477105 RepID=UPI00094F6E5B|nr:RagB/SusD family nutrient uptake outer membrane protein [Labilibacter marinus]
MKKILKYTLGVALAFSLLTSCEDELLNQANPNAITTDTFWKSRSDFDKAQNSLYSSLQFNSVCGGGNVNVMARADLGSGETWMGTYPWNNLVWNDATTFVERRWSELYIGIYRANQILYYLKDANFYTEDEKNLIAAQARFLRGLNYFWLVNDFDAAIIHEALPMTDEERHKLPSESEEVYSTIIYPDFEFAMEHLPATWDGVDNKGRFTWGAATAMLGKAYLYNEDWDTAAGYFKQIIDKVEEDRLYGFVDNFMDNFTDINEFNQESILEVSYSDKYKQGITGTRTDDVGDVAGSEAQSWANYLTSIFAGGYNSLMPTYWMQELFVDGDEIDPTNPINSGKLLSSRSYATIVALVERDDVNNWGEDGERYYNAPLLDTDNGKSKANFNYGQGSKVRKYISWYSKDTEDNQTQARSGINIRLIRLSDVYLMYAEALLEGSGDYTTALNYVDDVRRRAGVITLENYMVNNGGSFPQLDKVRFANELDEFDYVPMNAANLLHHIRMVERPLELAFEGHRWYDLVRWGMAKQVFDQRYAEELTLRELLLDANGDIPTEKERLYPLYLTERVRPSYGSASNDYSSGVHDYLPIPAIELQSNLAIQEIMRALEEALKELE